MARTEPLPNDPTTEDAAFVEAVKAGEASLDQGRSVPFAAVREWLLSWGTDGEKSPPKCP